MSFSEKLINRLLEYDKNTEGEIITAINEGKFKPIFRNNEWVGFLCWREIWKDGKLHIYINNLYIDEQYRTKENILNLRDFFRKKYRGNIRFAYWKNKRRDDFTYTT